jgi:hypothetical protein
MTLGNRHAQERALTDWLADYNWQVFGTLKFTDGESISDKKAEAIVRKFFNALDRAYLGHKLVDAGNRIERVVFRQLGHSGANLHFHFVANPTSSVTHFCETARCIWDEASTFTMGYENTVIEPVRSAARSGSYGLHEYRRLGSDTLHLDATHLDQRDVPSKPILTLRRLLRRHDKNEQTRERGLTRHADALRRRHIAAQAATH